MKPRMTDEITEMLLAAQATRITPLTPRWRERARELADRQLALLSLAVGDHLPVEIRERIADLEQERVALERLAATG